MAAVTLTIDGRAVTVEQGTTVLDAAREPRHLDPDAVPRRGPRAGLRLLPVLRPGRGRADPLAVVRAAGGRGHGGHHRQRGHPRRAAHALELLLSDHAGECIAPCAARCPAGLDVPGFVYEIAAGQNDRAMETIYDRLSLPGTLGRVCPRLCEQGCRRCDYDHEGLAIGALHRHATDRNQASKTPTVPAAGRPTGKKVAIVGAGPAGLTAAFYLQQRGHACTLFDAHPRPGGMLRYGIPDYRLPRAALDAEIELVQRLGATFRMRTRWGRDFTLDDLRRDHDAVFLGIGAQLSSRLRCEGEDLAVSGLDFLRRLAKGESPDLGHTRRGDRRRQHGHGRRPHRATPRRRGAGALSTDAGGDAVPDGGGRGRGGGGCRPRLPGGPGPPRPPRRRARAHPRLPADGAGRARRLGAAAPGAGPGLGASRSSATPSSPRSGRRSTGPWPSARAWSSPTGASPPTRRRWPRTCPGSSPAATRSSARTSRCARWPRAGSPRSPSTSTSRARRSPDPEELAAIALRPVDDEEQAAIFRQIEQAERVPTPTLDLEQRLGDLRRRSTRASTRTRRGARRCGA